MIEYRSSGSIFESGAQGLVNPVNCVGTMGAGLALAFKKKYPLMFKSYKSDCDAGRVRIGKVTVWRSVGEGGFVTYIFNFPTKDHWRDESRLEWIKDGLEDLDTQVRAKEISSLAIPALGCGYGGLHPAEVLPLIAERMSKLEILVMIYKPQ